MLNYSTKIPSNIIFTDNYAPMSSNNFEKINRLQEIGRQLWRELFLSIETEQQLIDWENRIPQYECNCKNFYIEWKTNNQPTFPLSFEWKYALKSAVNKKLERENIDIETARHIWKEIAQNNKDR